VRIRTHSFGVNEARLGLSVVTVLSVVLGYVALRRLGGTGEAPPVELRNPTASQGVAGTGLSQSPKTETIRVLPPQSTDMLEVPHVSRRPTWEAPTSSDAPIEFDLNGPDSLWPDDPARSGRTSARYTKPGGK
jgi:hypothetical protein